MHKMSSSSSSSLNFNLGAQHLPWLSTSEDSIFLQGDLANFADLLRPPDGQNDQNEFDQSIHQLLHGPEIAPHALGSKLEALCHQQRHPVAQLGEFQLQGLNELWKARQRWLKLQHDVQRKSNSQNSEELKLEDISTKLTLVLLFPLLSEASSTNSALQKRALDLVDMAIRNHGPMSIVDDGQSLDGLDDLLSQWINAGEDTNQMNQMLGTLVTLACVRRSTCSVLKCIRILHKQKSPQSPSSPTVGIELPVYNVVSSLLQREGIPRKPSVILGYHHVLSWKYPCNAFSPNQTTDLETNRISMTCSRSFLYLTSDTGSGLIKLGSAYDSTLRGYVYAKNELILPGFVAMADQILIQRPLAYDAGSSKILANIIDPNNLDLLESIDVPIEMRVEGNVTTLNLLANGTHFYWVRSFKVPEDLRHHTKVAHIVFVDSFVIVVLEGTPRVKTGSRTILERCTSKESSQKDTFKRILLGQMPPPDLSVEEGRESNSSISVAVDPTSTTCGIVFRILKICATWTDGSSLSFLVSQQASNQGFRDLPKVLFPLNWNSTPCKVLAVSLSFDLHDGMLLGRSEVGDCGGSSLGWNKGASLSGMGACYDPYRNLIWTASNHHLDEYLNSSLTSIHFLRRRLSLGEKLDISALPPLIFPSSASCLSQGTMMASVQDVLSVLVGHVGLLSEYASVASQTMSSSVQALQLGVETKEQLEKDFSHPEILNLALEMFEIFTQESNTQAASCMLACVKRSIEDAPFNETSDKSKLKGLKEQLTNILRSGQSSPSFTILVVETLTILHSKINVSEKERQLAYLEFVREDRTIHNFPSLKSKLLDIHIQNLLKASSDEEVVAQLEFRDFVSQIMKDVHDEHTKNIKHVVSCSTQQAREMLTNLPQTWPEIKFLQSVVFKLAFCTGTSSKLVLRRIIQNILQDASSLMKVTSRALESITNKYNGEGTTLRLRLLEKLSMTSLTGSVLSTVIVLSSHEAHSELDTVKHSIQDMVQLNLECRKIAYNIQNQLEDEEKDDEESGDQESDATSTFVPCPWDEGRIIESVHPLRENYKVRETFTILGTKHLYLFFDPRCSTQYDYDKVVLYQGKSVNGKKIAEFGGNTFGVGSKSVLGSGWPNQAVVIECDSVTVAFEMRSSREQGVPDKALWGFKIYVKTLNIPPGLSPISHFAALSLSLEYTTFNMLRVLFQGQSVTAEEQESEVLLRSRLLQQCTWQAKTPLGTSPTGFEGINDDDLLEPDVNRIPLCSKLISKLRNLSETRLPPLRPSVKTILKPECLEEAIVSSVIKHLGFQDFIKYFDSHEKDLTQEYYIFCDIISETYMKYHALVRRLQVLAELENQWNTEVDDVRENMTELNSAFFVDYQHHESKSKELSLLCFLKGVSTEDGFQNVTERLKLELQKEATNGMAETSVLELTSRIVKGIMERIELLLQVSINIGKDNEDSNGDRPTFMSRSLQNWPKKGSRRGITKQQSVEIERSLDDSILQIPKLKKQVKKIPTVRSVIENLAKGKNTQEDDRTPESVVLDQLFAFIGSHPEKAVSAKSFVKAALVRRQRSRCRIQALALIKGILSSSYAIGGTQEIVSLSSVILQDGIKAQEITCGSLVTQTEEAFADTLLTLVQLIESQPELYKIDIARLTIIPYSRDEETCLVKCGLLKLLDKLCGYHQTSDDEVDVEMQSDQHRLSEVAWLGFKVLTNRCIDWEENDSSALQINHGAGLATQISSLLTNHLLKAARGSNHFMNCSVLQEVLTLLSSLVKCQIGRDILSKPKCVSTLLALMLETRLSPKMILSITRLCHIALPLMSSTDCDQVEVPDWFLGNIKVVWPSNSNARDKIVDLLLTKMGDFIVPGVAASLPHHATFSKRSTRTATKSESKDQHRIEANPNVELARECNTLSLIIHKREDESAQDIVQKLLNSNHELRLFRPVGNEPMEKVVIIDQHLGRSQKAEILTEDATLVLRKATKMAQHGFTVSIEPPDKVDQNPEQRLLQMEEVCRDKNRVLLRSSPQRPFVSSQVANTLATEVVSLINSLLHSKKADLWSDTILNSLKRSMEKFSDFLSQESLLFSADQSKLLEVFSLGRTILASLSILGSFQETLKEGMEISVVSENGTHSPGVIKSVDWEHWTAMVLLNVEQPNFQIPLTCIRSQQQFQVETFRPLYSLIIKMSQLLLVPNSLGHDYLSTPLPGSSDGQDLRLMTARLVSEIRASTCAVLAQYTRDEEFSSRFMQESCHAVDMLKCLAKEVGAVDHIEKVRINCVRLRGIYRDCVKPPLLESQQFGHQGLLNHWNVNLAFPPLKSLLFTYRLTGITYHADPTLASGLPRGNLVYAQHPLNRTNSYFEVNIISLGENHEETTSPLLSIGLAPKAEKKDSSWTNPNGTVLLHNNGRLVHYNGPSLLQWRSLRFDLQMSPGDIIGIGWEASHADPKPTNSPNLGTLYFTQNGTRLSQELEGVPLGLFPIIHLQKRDTRIRANFGQIEFAHHPIITTEDARESSEPPMSEIESDDVMPFRRCSAESEKAIMAGDHRSNPYSSRPAPKVKLSAPLAPESVLSHRLARHGNPQARSGPFQADFINLDEDSDFEDLYDEDAIGIDSDNGELESRPETANSLLVKAWETRVFPVIRRRFRNEAERRDGLEQIKGALSLGMTDIARQTVEFLYEENGGIPADMHLPTLEDMKEEMLKLSIDQIKRGDSVSIRTLTEKPPGASFYSASQLKTFGLIGEVLDTDKQEELVLVETYLKSEGILVSFWYPLPYLSKPNKGQQAEGSSFSSNVNVSFAKSSLIHRELLSQEFVLSRLWCRSAYLNLHKHAQAGDLSEFAPENPNSSKLSMLTSSTMLLQDVDLENLQILSNHYSGNELCTNNLLECNLVVRGAKEILAHQVGNRQELFFSSGKTLDNEIQRILNKILSDQDQGMEHLLEIVNMVCQCLFHCCDYFVSEEIVINDISTLKSLIHFRDTAFVAVNVKLPSSLGRDPEDLQIQIQTMNGSIIRPNGTTSAKNVLQYPVQVNGGDDTRERAFPDVILPTNLVRISQGGGAESGTVLHLFGIPLQFPLAIRFIHDLVKVNVEQIGSQPFEEIVVGLSHILLQLDAPPTFRMIIMDQLTQVLQILPEKMSIPAKLRQLNLYLIQELSLLEEQDKQVGAVRHSIYFQTSFELLLAVYSRFRDSSDEHAAFHSKLEKAHKSLRRLKSGMVSYKIKGNIPNRPLPPAWIFLSSLPTHLEIEDMKSTLEQALAKFGGLRSSGFHWSERDSVRTIILELRFHANISQAVDTLLEIKWIHQTFQVNGSNVKPEVSTLNNKYECSNQSLQSQRIVDTFLKEKVLESNRLTKTIHEVFQATLGLFDIGDTKEGGESRLTSEQIMHAHPENKVREVIMSLVTDSDLHSALGKFGTKVSSPDHDHGEQSLKESAIENIEHLEEQTEKFTMTEKQFTSFVMTSASGKIQAFLVALANCGYDHNLGPTSSQDPEQKDSKWTIECDNQLVRWMEDTAYDFLLNPSQIHPQEIHLSPEDHLKMEFCHLRSKSDQELGRHAALLLDWNKAVFRDLIPNIPLTCDRSNCHSSAAFLTRHKSKLFSFRKEIHLNQILNASCQRGRDQVAPEVSLNPITSIGSSNECLSATWFFQAWQQLRDVLSSQLCVAMAQGSDPEFPFKVKFVGEEVHGSSGSFRQFFSHVTDEIHGTVLSLTIPYLGLGPFKGRYQLRCCPLTWINERLLQFWGQLIGIALRAGIPFVLDMVPTFWQALLQEDITEKDLRLMDPNLFQYMSSLQNCPDESTFDTLLEEHQFPRFTFQSNGGMELPLSPNGENKYLSFKNRAEYCDLVLKFKLSELVCSGHISQIRAGLSTVVPLEILHCLYTPTELELRVCGSPRVSVQLLQKHTIYQAGLTVDEEHIQFFWNALESFTDRQLSRFIKFACNQERLPQPNLTDTSKVSDDPSEDERAPTLHTPPFPMMIAPSDKGDVQVEQQNIRVETCMFMLKLPRYPSFDMMRDKLLFAIHAAYDPLSG